MHSSRSTEAMRGDHDMSETLLLRNGRGTKKKKTKKKKKKRGCQELISHLVKTAW